VPLTIQSNVKDPGKIRERRAQIVSAAVRLFSEKGFHKTTTREIAKASGLSNGALYEYVKSKEDVLFLVCEHIHQEMREQLEKSLIAHADGKPCGAMRLRDAIQAFFRVIDSMKDDVLLIYQESKSLPSPFLREVLKNEQLIAEMFEQLLREGIQDKSLNIPEDLVPLLAHDIVVCGQMWAFRRWALKAVSFERFSELQVNMLMQACGADDMHSAIHHTGQEESL
jgi:AcrR family transcriptional regulator